jgi:hypothetical protein
VERFPKPIAESDCVIGVAIRDRAAIVGQDGDVSDRGRYAITDFLLEGLGTFFGTIQNSDPRALLEESLDDGFAQTRGAAGHQSYLPLQLVHMVLLLLRDPNLAARFYYAGSRGINSRSSVCGRRRNPP